MPKKKDMFLGKPDDVIRMPVDEIPEGFIDLKLVELQQAYLLKAQVEIAIQFLKRRRVDVRRVAWEEAEPPVHVYDNEPNPDDEVDGSRSHYDDAMRVVDEAVEEDGCESAATRWSSLHGCGSF